MTERRTLGEILKGFGRITEEEVKRALEHQRVRGGYFGEALLELGMLTQEELEWGLASQFDLPYVFPDADSIDPDAAALVTPEWALANLTLPIMRTARTLTVVVDSPTKAEAVEDLERRSGLEIELALASGEKIRELIRQVYARASSPGEEPETRAPLTLGELFSRSLEAAGARFGISVRGRQAVGWYDDRGAVHRRLLTSSWNADLEQLLDPPPSDRVEARSHADWSARLERDGVVGPVEVRYLSATGGREYLFLEGEGDGVPEVESRFSSPNTELLSEIELLVRSGSARFAVSTDPPELARELLPHLPGLLLPPSRRAVHLAERDLAGDETFAITLPTDPEARRAALVELRAFRFDAVTADLEGAAGDWAHDVLDLAGTVFLPLDAFQEDGATEEAGIRWELRATSTEAQEGLEWVLRPLTS